MVTSTNGGLSVLGIRDKLDEMDFDLSKYKNPVASIHTAINRMVESEEVKRVPENKNEIQAGKNMKVPALPEADALQTLAELVKGMREDEKNGAIKSK